MRASLNEIREIEHYLSGSMPAEERLVFEAQSIVNAPLAMRISLQKKLHAVLKFYHRRKRKQQAEALHAALFTDPSKISFRESILKLFA